MKQCSKCKEWKEANPTAFNRNKRMKDGLDRWCKVCCAEYQKSDKGKIAHKKYNQSDKGKANQARANHSNNGKARLQKYNNSSKASERNRRYRINNSKKLIETTQKYKRNNPERTKAHDAVSNAIRANKIPKASTSNCSICGKQAQDYHHYLGYSKIHWFDIKPICKSCHKLIHKNQLLIE